MKKTTDMSHGKGKIPDSNKTTKSAKTKYRVRIKSKTNSSPALRYVLHHAHSSKKIESYNTRFHSGSQADLLFDSFEAATQAHQKVSVVLPECEVMSPVSTRSKLIHVVGLTGDDTVESVYSALSKPGRNHPIDHLINPASVRVLQINECNSSTKEQPKFRASLVVSDAIHEIVFNKMHRKIKVDYLSCNVYDRPASNRCSNCQVLGHSETTCKNDPACVVCGGSHSADSCPNTNNPKCVNCSSNNIDNSHRADWDNCPSYLQYRDSLAKK